MIENQILSRENIFIRNQSPYLILFSIKLIQLQLNYLFTLTLLKTSFIELKGWSENY